MLETPAVRTRADHVELPIIAAGGMCDARSAAAALVLGAEGVQMGTRMLASLESAVHANFKDAIVAANDSGTVLLAVPGNPTMRVLRTGLAARVAANDPEAELLGKITELYSDGDMEASVANTGQVSSRIADVLPVSEIVQRTWKEIESALAGALPVGLVTTTGDAPGTRRLPPVCARCVRPAGRPRVRSAGLWRADAA